MTNKRQNVLRRFRAWFARKSKVARITLWLLAAIVAILLFGHSSGIKLVLVALCTVVLVPLLLILLYRWASRKLLWRVRNRLILTYLLMGLAPVVLFGTLTGIAAYLLAGQYSTNTALSQLNETTTEVRNEAAGAAVFSLLRAARTDGHPGQTGRLGNHPAHWGGPDISLAVLQNGTWSALPGDTADKAIAPSPFLGQHSPAWLQNGFRGIVAYNGQLYLCAMVSVSEASHPVPILGTRPLNSATLASTAEGLGRVTLLPGFTHLKGTSDSVEEEQPSNVPDTDEDHGFDLINGGVLPPRSHFVDPPVLFSAPIPIYAWRTGKQANAMLAVLSRPGLLYTHLFATSVSIGVFVRDALIAIGVAFALIELLALLMAAGLSRTITRAISELYRGTTEIDHGHLDHRVKVARHDQLGALATSFNQMAASITDLLQQQREKERLLSELAIAQEVQTNLFPKSPVTLGDLDLHAVCIPARTVSGDYFDFIFGRGTGLCLALGDISGKGISAALLMATLHSAVRAFGVRTTHEHSGHPSPALLLKLINRHLYSSTQPEKYATLFLAYYDVDSRKLTYSNGGHLPPVIISTDGSIQELTCGGSVVGLLSGLEYEEATVQLRPGDLLMAYTDGLTEPESEFDKSGEFGEPVEFGEKRLVNFVQQHSQQSLPALADSTLKVLQDWIGNSEQPDDMTILLARQR